MTELGVLRTQGGGTATLRRAVVEDVASIVELLTDDPLGVARDGSDDPDGLRPYVLAFEAIDAVAAAMPAMRATPATPAAVAIVAPEPQALAFRLIDRWMAVAAPKHGKP